VTRRRFSFCLAAAAGALLASGGGAVSVQFWECAGQAAFEKGEFEGTRLSSEGYLRLAPEFEDVHTAESSILLSVEASPDGRYLFYGEGMTGNVYRWDAKAGKAELWFSSRALYVRDMEFLGGALYVATAPAGAVYRVASPESTAMFWKAPAEPERDVYVWALCADGAGGLYVGAGPTATIYHVNSQGEGTPVFKSSDAYVTSLARDSAGTLFSGTYNQGLVLKTDKKGATFALYDSELAQITSLAAAPDGSLYAAATTVEETPSSPQERKPSASGGNESREEGETVVYAKPKFSQKLQSAIYRILPSGLTETYAEFEGATIYDMRLSGRGTLWVATGDPGRLYEVTGSGEKTLVAEFEANQGSAIAEIKGTLFVGTSNPGKIYRSLLGRGAEGRYLSQVYDMKKLVRWGEISWLSEPEKPSDLRLWARCGNVEEPDDTWSPWHGPLTSPEGEAIACPAGRYVQWKAEWTGREGQEGSSLREVRVAAMPFNSPPQVMDIEVYEPGVVFSVPAPSSDPVEKFLSGDEGILMRSDGSTSVSLGRRMFKKGMRTVQWFARDEDGDVLRFRIYYRAMGGGAWTELSSGFMRESVFAWDTLRVPDGRYEVRVDTDDSLSNFMGTERQGSKVGEIIAVDNTAPRIGAVDVAGRRARFRVEDAASGLWEVQVSQRNGEWRAAAPVDSVLDGREEDFEIALEDGCKVLGIRAIDRSRNSASIYADVAERK
jgi:hypothetical protein